MLRRFTHAQFCRGKTTFLSHSNFLRYQSSIPAKLEPFHVKHIDPPAMHKSFDKWIIFSDLHVKGSSIDTCIELLDLVDAEARKRNAGIIFLGDFWHVRGALNVDLLSRIMKSLEKWSQPVIMIPGNHDQVTLGGIVHALEPIQYAFRSDQVLLISEPVVCMGALWVPYRRDTELMKDILKTATTTADPSIIFCHADVCGAYMNDGMKSKEGLDISHFPQHLPVYSGHFHKPHMMCLPGTSEGDGGYLQYVGSPYQTSLSEAGQEKYLYLMNCDKEAGSEKLLWKRETKWPIHLQTAKKYFKASVSQEDVMNQAKSGDQLVLTVKKGEDVEQLVTSLSKKGVEVVLRQRNNKGTASAFQGLRDLENKDPMLLFREYMKSESVLESMSEENLSASESDKTDGTTAARTLHDHVLSEGEKTISKLRYTVSNVSKRKEAASAANTFNDGLDASMTQNAAAVKDLKMTSVTLKNFGPYGSREIKYPLNGRGLVLIRGKSTDGTGADSNGAGKTTLAMSVLWALTGSLDTRLISDGRAADVAFDTALSNMGTDTKTGKTTKKKKANPMAEVAVEGEINNQPFKVIRRRGVKKTELLFHLNGVDLTQQAIKDTQESIDILLGTGGGLLQRCSFFGQHSHTLQALLGLTDVKLKNEMSSLVDTSLWVSACQDVKDREKALSKQLSDIQVEKKFRHEEANRKLAETKVLERQMDSMRIAIDAEKTKIFQSISSSADTNVEEVNLGDYGDVAALEAAVLAVQSTVEDRTSAVTALRKELHQRRSEKTAALSELNSLQSRAREKHAGLIARQKYTSSNKEKSTKKRHALLAAQEKVKHQFKLMVGKIDDVAIPSEEHLQDPGLLIAEGVCVDVEALRSIHEQSIAALASCDARLTTTQEALSRLLVADAEHAQHTHTHDPSDGSQSIPSGPGKCPTCGHLLDIATFTARKETLADAVAALELEKSLLTKECEMKRIAYDLGMKAQNLLEQVVHNYEKVVECEKELLTLEDALVEANVALQKSEGSLEESVMKHTQAYQAHMKLEEHTFTQLCDEENTLLDHRKQEAALRDTLNKFRIAETEFAKSKANTKGNLALSLLEGKLATLAETLASEEGKLRQLHELIDSIEVVRSNHMYDVMVLDRLSGVLGTRGIQHYVFLEVLELLESIGNVYLGVLAEGGIQLQLKASTDVDQISKSVSIRGSDGIFRDRNLSQLSGGQWRRVSFALDLAFADILRKRGILRSNIMVMDEILTHLDASGREAVGSVLRSMVCSTGSTTGGEEENVECTASAVSMLRQLHGEKGLYDTVMVILQDLSAMELEEAFDRVDVVYKEGDSSTVFIDGSDSQL